MTLVAHDTSSAGSSPVIETFEVATDAAFAHIVWTASAVLQPDGRSVLSGKLNTGQQYFWHVRSGRGEALAGFSEVFTFSTTAPLEDTSLAASPPILRSPVQGSLVGPQLTVVVQDAGHSNNVAEVELQVSSSPSFSSLKFSNLWPADPNQEVSFFVGPLPPGVWYWRARTRVTRSGGSLNQGVASEYSPVWTFTVAAQELQKSPIPLQPVSGSDVHNHPTLTVRNATRIGAVGPVVYRFVVGTSTAPIATATVPEGPDQTSWTVPVDLVVGLTYQWSAVAVDTSSGIEMGGGHLTFTVVAQRANLLKLEIQPPSTCGPYLTGASVYATSQDVIGAGTFHLSTLGDLSIDAINRGGVVSGIIGGSLGNVSVSASTTDTGPTTLSGIIGEDGTMSGAFSGHVRGSNFYGDGGSCTASNFRWTVSPVRQ